MPKLTPGSFTVEQANCEGCFETAEHADDRSNDACFGAGLDSVARDVLEEASKAGRTGKGAKRPTGPPNGAGLNGWYFAEMRRIGDQKLRREIVRPFDNQALALQELHRRVGNEAAFERPNRNPRRPLAKHRHRAFDFRSTDVVAGVEGLPVQVALLNLVVVDDGDLRNATLSEQAKHRRAEPARPDHQNTMRLHHLKYSPKLK